VGLPSYAFQRRRFWLASGPVSVADVDTEDFGGPGRWFRMK
jgi:hypothetical protein